MAGNTPVTNFTAMGDSGTDFSQAIGPEPATGWLLAGACFIGWRRLRR
jgi:hypothetical protein